MRKPFIDQKKGDVVYDIKIYKESCVVDEFHKGKIIGMTRSKTLERAFQQKFMACEWRQTPDSWKLLKGLQLSMSRFQGLLRMNRDVRISRQDLFSLFRFL